MLEPEDEDNIGMDTDEDQDVVNETVEKERIDKSRSRDENESVEGENPGKIRRLEFVMKRRAELRKAIFRVTRKTGCEKFHSGVGRMLEDLAKDSEELTFIKERKMLNGSARI